MAQNVVYKVLPYSELSLCGWTLVYGLFKPIQIFNDIECILEWQQNITKNWFCVPAAQPLEHGIHNAKVMSLIPSTGTDKMYTFNAL